MSTRRKRVSGPGALAPGKLLLQLFLPTLILGCAPGLLIYRKILSRDFDPNIEEVDFRIRLGQARAIGRVRLDQILQSSGRLPRAGASPPLQGPFLESSGTGLPTDKGMETHLTLPPPFPGNPEGQPNIEAKGDTPHSIKE